jgi:hypothetical protein
LDQWLPLTSKDLDLFSTLALLQGMKERFGGEYLTKPPQTAAPWFSNTPERGGTGVPPVIIKHPRTIAKKILVKR